MAIHLTNPLERLLISNPAAFGLCVSFLAEVDSEVLEESETYRTERHAAECLLTDRALNVPSRVRTLFIFILNILIN